MDRETFIKALEIVISKTNLTIGDGINLESICKDFALLVYDEAINYTHCCESDSEQYCECDKPALGKSISRCGTCDEWFKPLK